MALCQIFCIIILMYKIVHKKMGKEKRVDIVDFYQDGKNESQKTEISSQDSSP